MTKPFHVALAVLACALLLPLRLPAQPERFALVIGVSEYPGFPQDNRLRYADDDAVRFRDFIVSPAGGGFAPANVLLVTNAAATRDSIAHLVRWLKTRVQPTDALYVFFSGHTSTDLGRVYFMPIDARQDNPSARGWEAAQFWAMFRDIHPRFLVMFVDACKAASLVDPGAKGSGGSGDLLKALDALLEQEESQAIALLSSTGSQASFEDPELQSGLFTHYLLKGLRGAADASGPGNRDSVVTLREVIRFVQDSVEARSRLRFQQLQSPTHTPSSTTFPLAYLRPSEARPAAPRAGPLLDRAVAARNEFNQGRANFDRLNYLTAQQHYEAALAIDPNFTLARNNLGYLHFRAGRLRDALAAYREAATRDPRSVLALRSWGEMAMLLKDTTQAIQAYNAAYAVDPRDPILLHGLSLALWDRDRAASFRYAFAAVDADSLYTQGRLHLASRLAETQQAELAIEHYGIVARLDTGATAAEAHAGRASWLVVSHDWVAAIPAYQAAAALEADETKRRGLALAQNLLQTGLTALEDSARRTRDLLRSSPGSAALKTDLVALYTNDLFRFDSALAVARRWRQAHPGDAAGGLQVAEALLALGRYADSRAVLDSLRRGSLPADERLVLEALSFGNALAVGDTNRADAVVETVFTLFRSRPARERPIPWSFTGVRHHLRAATGLGPKRIPLLMFFEILQRPDGMDVERRLTAMFAPPSTR